MTRIKISKKSKRVYNMLRELDINVINDNKHWQIVVDAIYYEVYNDKK